MYSINELYEDKTQREDIQKYQQTIETVTNDKEITIIPNESFKGFSSMKTINISSTVNEIK